MKVSELYKISPVGVVGCLVSGFLVGAFYTMSPSYIAQMGFGTTIISLFMFFGIFGAMLAQLPIGRLSDKMDRRYVLAGIGIATSIVAFLTHPLIGYGMLYMAIGAMLLGSCIMVIYPICISHINDLIDDTQRVKVSGLIILLQGIGLIVGPIVVSFLIEKFGNFAFVVSYSSLGILFSVFVVRNIFVKRCINYVSVTPSDPVPLAPTPVFEALSTDDTMVDRLKKSKARKSNKI
jgi:MFS family permease